MSCGVGHRRASDLALLWLWCRLAATAPIPPLAWEPPYAMGIAQEMENKKTNQEEIQFKMLLIGEQAVGKSSLINQYVEGKFELNLLCAAGLDLKKKMITVNNKQVKLMIYDSAGHERYRGLAKNQLHTTKGILIVYDVTERSSFDALTFWLKSYKENAESGSVCLVIGNKIDLKDKRVVSTEEGKNIAQQYGVHFIETSAKDAINVE